jgi:hypothetical protein
MTEPLILPDAENAERGAVEGKFMALFSGADRKIWDVIEVLRDLELTPGIHSFMTPLSWAIRRSNGTEINGNDLNLLDAVKSISGALHSLASNPENDDERISLVVRVPIFHSKRYVLSKDVMEGFAPYPAKWLKRERWLEFTKTAETLLSPVATHDIGDDAPENKEWGAILHGLHGMHGEAVYRSWFRQLRLGEMQGSVLTLRAPSRFVAQWLQSHYGADITRAV